jgi:catechol 2,3-dioxygenase-like lactoylglutathione lyase family enzyme
MSKISGVHHIAVRALDFERSVRFYNETLGLATKNTWTREQGRACLIEITPGSYIEIFEWQPETFSGEPPILHYCLRTDDVDGMVERARSDGYAVTIEPLSHDVETSIGVMHLRLAYIEGPDGEKIELMTSDIV